MFRCIVPCIHGSHTSCCFVTKTTGSQTHKCTTLQTSRWLRSIAVYWLFRAACQNSQGSVCVCLRVCMHVIGVSPLWFMTQCCPLLSPLLLPDTAHLPVSLPQSLPCTAAEHNSISKQKHTGWGWVIRTHLEMQNLVSWSCLKVKITSLLLLDVFVIPALGDQSVHLLLHYVLHGCVYLNVCPLTKSPSPREVVERPPM